MKRIKADWAPALYFEDLFHTILHFTTYRLLALLVLMYFVGFAVFVPFYMLAIDHCNTDFKTPLSAFFFSVETVSKKHASINQCCCVLILTVACCCAWLKMMTIGYGATDPFFADCWYMAGLISFQSVIGTILDAICIGLLYDRISRATVRIVARLQHTISLQSNHAANKLLCTTVDESKYHCI